MIRRSLKQTYEQLPAILRKEITILKYKNGHTCLLFDGYGICRGNIENLKKGLLPSIRSALNKTKYFKQMLKERFPLYEKDYQVIGKFTRSSTPILIRGEHGDCLVKPDTLLRGALPHIKSAVNKSEYFISVFNKLHDNRYTYPDYAYDGSSKMITVNCKLHGNFIQKNYVHAMGSGCQGCAADNKSLGYSRSDFIKNAKARECTLYIIKCSSAQEEFYKIGITVNSVNRRYSGKSASKRIPYNYNIVSKHLSLNAGSIYDLEKQIFKKYKKDFSYRPKLSFHGESECFNLELPINEIIKELEQLKLDCETQTGRNVAETH